MTRFTILAAFCAALAITGCTGRVSHEEAKTSGSSTTVVEVRPLGSPPPVPEPPPDPQPPFIDQEGTGNVIVFGDLEQHHHLHFHEVPEPPNVRIDVRLQVDVNDERERRRRMLKRRLAELQAR